MRNIKKMVTAAGAKSPEIGHQSDAKSPAKNHTPAKRASRQARLQKDA
jgi:hypothetical protein